MSAMSLLGDDSVQMEGLMKVAVVFILSLGYLFFPLCRSEGAEKGAVKIAYFNKIFGHLHRRSDVNSSTLTVLDCNTPATIIFDGAKKGRAKWYYVKAGVYEGFIKKINVSFAPVECFQKKYPRFFESIKMDPGEQYHWGKLYGRYEAARSKVP